MKKQSSRLISSVFEEFVKEDGLEEGLLRARIFEAWDLVLAARLAPYSSSEEVRSLTSRKFFKEGVLTCRMSSSVVRSQLRMYTEDIRSELNKLLSGDYVQKIVIS